METLKCHFCGGFIKPEGYCLHCGRSTDIEYEKMVQEESKKDHHFTNPYYEYKGRKKKVEVI